MGLSAEDLAIWYLTPRLGRDMTRQIMKSVLESYKQEFEDEYKQVRLQYSQEFRWEDNGLIYLNPCDIPHARFNYRSPWMMDCCKATFRIYWRRNKTTGDLQCRYAGNLPKNYWYQPLL